MKQEKRYNLRFGMAALCNESEFMTQLLGASGHSLDQQVSDKNPSDSELGMSAVVNMSDRSWMNRPFAKMALDKLAP